MAFLPHLSRRRLLAMGATLPVAGAGITAVGTTADSAQDPVRPYGLDISPDFPFSKKSVDVQGSQIAYVDEGAGQPVLFLHGNPTSSYLWRNIIPYVTAGYRAVAPDMIGMGDSAKPDIGYTFLEHAAYIDGFIEALGLNDIILVIHDWGSAIGMRYARMNPGRVAAIAFMEAIVPPSLPVPGFDVMPKAMGDFFRMVRTDDGKDLILGKNFFVETVLPTMGVLRPMSASEMEAYRRPFPTRESRLPTLQWPREIPIGGNPAEATAEVLANGEWLYASDVPKLLFYAEPGSLAPKPVVEHMTTKLTNLETRFLGAGLHFLQEEHPHLIGQGLADWLRRI
ncbi:MAG: haloalkane dehalogenase [Pseudomonadota bacterium]